jgi:hypothetical protein
VLETPFGVVLGELLALAVELRGVAHIGQREPRGVGLEQLAEHERVVVVRGAVVGDDQRCATASASLLDGGRCIGLLAMNPRLRLCIRELTPCPSRRSRLTSAAASRAPRISARSRRISGVESPDQWWMRGVITSR